jgi:23S rRNA pseudouridine1911/1915/1917 synthase
MRRLGESYKPRFVSRLDMDTSGVLLIGKNSHAQDNLAKQSARGGVEKVYLAILSGRLEDDMPQAGLIDLPIGLAAPGEPRRAVLSEAEGGYPSRTAYEVLRTITNPAQDGGGVESALTVVRARLLTGRTHQIRVHFSHSGYPVLGDHLYGSPSPLIARQALHACSLAVDHPSDGRRMFFEAPLPPDMAAILL